MGIRNILRSLNPFSSANPFNQFQNLISGIANYAPQDSPVYVDQQTAMSSAVVSACIRRISSDIAVLPRNIVKDGIKDKNHQNYRLLNRRPNPYMTSMDYFETAMGHLLLWENHYSFLNWEGNSLEGIYPLLPWLMVIQNRGNDIIYTYNGISTTAENILHVHGFSFNGEIGRSRIDDSRHTIGISLAQDQFLSKYYKQGAIIDKTLNIPGKLSTEQRAHLKKSMLEYRGVNNAGVIPLLESGTELKTQQLTLDLAQFCAAREYQAKDICRLFNISPALVGEEGGLKYSNLEIMTQSYVNQTLLYWIRKWEEEIHRKCFLEREKDLYSIQFDTDYILRGDTKTRIDNYYKGLSCGIYNLDDVMELEGRPAIGGETGSVRLSPLNLGPVGQMKEEPPKEEPKEQTNSAAIEIVERDFINRLWTKEKSAIERLYKSKQLNIERAEQFYEKHEPLVRSSLASLSILKNVPIDEIVIDYVGNRINTLSTAIENRKVEDWINGN